VVDGVCLGDDGGVTISPCLTVGFECLGVGLVEGRWLPVEVGHEVCADIAALVLGCVGDDSGGDGSLHGDTPW
jgi:hypothetical protein